MSDPSAKWWIFELRDTLSHAQFVKMVVTLLVIWTARRNVIHENIFQSLMSTHLFIERFINELDSIKVLSSLGKKVFFKIYVDGGLLVDGKRACRPLFAEVEITATWCHDLWYYLAPQTRRHWRF